MLSANSATPESHFKIHVAKAKDLPLSWYDLVLRPQKFAEHLKILVKDPEASPSAAYLIVTFLDKAEVLSALTSSLANNAEFKESVEKEKSTKLVQCALLVASCLNWDSPCLWKELPFSVQFCLLSFLRTHYHFPEGGVTMGVVNTEAVVASVLYSVWVLEFIVRQCHSTQAPHRAGVQTWEANCTPTEHIKDMVRGKAELAVSILTSYLEQVDELPASDLPVQYAVPKVSVDLQVPSGGGHVVHVEPTKSPFMEDGANFLSFLCKVRYALGCYYLVVGDFQTAQSQLLKTQEQLEMVKSTCDIVEGELRGYLAACSCVLQTGGSRGGGVGKDPAVALDFYFKKQDFKGIESVLVKDIGGKDKISPSAIFSLELQASTLNLAAPPEPKRSRLDPVSALSLKDRLVVYGCLKKVLQGQPPPPRLWRIVGEEDNSPCLAFLLKVCEAIYKEGLPTKKKQLLWTFLRCMCTRKKKWWELLLRTSFARQHAKRENTEGMFGPSIVATSNDDSDSTHSPSSLVNRLEKKVGLATSAQEVKDAVEELWEVLPSSEHSNILAKWVWSGKGYAQSDTLLNPVVLIKYNCLLHRAQAMAKFQMYQQSLDLMLAAQELVRSAGSVARQQLEDFLQEYVLMLELKLFHLSRCGLSEMRGPLLAKARAYYTTQRWSEWETWYVVGAFLINMHELQFITQQKIRVETFLPPSKLPIRLAEAVVKVQEGKDLRKSIRSLFEAVVQVFLPPFSATEVKSEVQEKQARLRSNLDLFIKNLTEPTALSLLIAALARMWNILKKPEDEISVDYVNHWPTVIGNAASIDPVHVLRMLNITLSHALQLHPHSASWILVKANTHNALGEHGAALEGYMEAAALSSKHFQESISETVWSSSVLHRLINCCLRLTFHTQAAILCQLLRPVDYELAFRILRDNAESMVENMFEYFWDMTIIEYLIHIQSKKPDSKRHMTAVQIAGQPDLNFHNSAEVLNRAAEVRRRKFLRTLYSQITHAL